VPELAIGEPVLQQKISACIKSKELQRRAGICNRVLEFKRKQMLATDFKNLNDSQCTM